MAQLPADGLSRHQFLVVSSFERIRQLQDAGKSTLFVGLMDAGDVKARERPFLAARASFVRPSGVLAELPSEPALPKLIRKLTNFARYQVESRVRRLRDAMKVRELRAGAKSQPLVSHAPPVISYLRICEVFHREHAPKGVLNAGRVFLFWAMEGDGSVGDTPHVEVFSDPAFGWKSRVSGGVEIVDMPGGHSSMLWEPNVRVLARSLQEHSDGALSGAGHSLSSAPDDESVS